MAGTCCRQSPGRGLVGSLIVGGFLIGFSLIAWYSGAPALFWGGGAVLTALLVPWFFYDALAKFRATNWLLRLGPDGLWINLRSYQNSHLPEAATVVFLPYEEIAAARRHEEHWTTPASPSATTGTYWTLEALVLSVAPATTSAIAQALVEERARHAAIKGTHQAVTVPTAGAVHIAWRGQGNDVVPPLARVLEELGRRVPVEEPTRRDFAFWLELEGNELDELVERLVRSGDSVLAAQLLMRRRGCSSTEAHRIVDERARAG